MATKAGVGDQWRRIVRHESRPRTRGEGAVLLDALECGHVAKCSNWFDPDHPNVHIAEPSHWRRNCRKCRRIAEMDAQARSPEGNPCRFESVPEPSGDRRWNGEGMGYDENYLEED